MAAQYLITTGTVALATGVAKTCVELVTSATAGVTIVGVELTWSRTTASSCVVEWGTFTTTGTGTTVTPAKWGTGQSAAANVGTCKVANTAEPAGFATAGLPSWVVPIPGMYSVLYAAGREFYQPPGVNRCLRLNQSGGTGNVRIDVYFEN